jgi:hypothetical protein
MKLYKVLDARNRSIHGGCGKWTPGRWRSVRGDLIPCKRGLHLCRADQVLDWLGPRIWEVETDGEVIEHGNKYIARKARIVREVTPTDAQLRHFAADRAEEALVYADPEWRETLEVVIHTVRAYADGAASDAELTAAGAAASAAARAAAWDAELTAAGAAAGAAARAAASHAGLTAAGAAASAAARGAFAAWAAAGDAGLTAAGAAASAAARAAASHAGLTAAGAAASAAARGAFAAWAAAGDAGLTAAGAAAGAAARGAFAALIEGDSA